MQAVNVSLDTIQNLQQASQQQTQKTSQSSSFSFLDLVKTQSTETASSEQPEKIEEPVTEQLSNQKENSDSKIAEKKDEAAPEAKVEAKVEPVKGEKTADQKTEISDKGKAVSDNKNTDKTKNLTEKSYSLMKALMNKNSQDASTQSEIAETNETEISDDKKNVKAAVKKNGNSVKKADENSVDLIHATDELDINALSAVQNNIKPLLNDKNLDSNGSKESSDKDFDMQKKSVKVSSKASFTVTDLRTNTENPEQKNDDSKVSSKANFKTSINYNGDNDIQLTFDLNQNQVNQNILSSNSQTAGAASSNFQAMLENLIQENAPDFARAGSIVLKDNNIGNISLVLHPESLGNVKINLEMTDKIITGHITVNSKEAMAAFEGNLDNLKNAFSQNGFETASFDLSMAGQNAGGFKNGGQSDSRQMQLLSNNLYGDYTTEGVSAVAGNAEAAYAGSDSNYKINIVA